MDKIQVLTLLVLLPPLVSFAWNGIVIPWRRAGKPAAYLSILAMAVSMVSSIFLVKAVLANPGTHYWKLTWLPMEQFNPIKVGLLIDNLSAVMLVVVTIVSLMVQIYSLGYMSEETPGSLGRYYTYHYLFSFSMMGLTVSSSLLQMYIFWELVGLCSYLLIGFWYYKPSAANAAVKAFWTTRFGDVGFALGIAILWTFAGTLSLPELFNKADAGTLSVGAITLTMALVFIGAMGKSAQFPLHIWLPDAMEGPTPVSALIHAATMVAAGVYLVARLFPLYSHSHGLLVFITYIGSFTAFIAATMALVQEDIKRVLAYSTISQLGYMMAALGAGSVFAGFFHLFTHAYFKALLFLAAGSVIHAMHTNDIWKMGKLATPMKQTAIVFIIGSLALIGIPPFAGYFSKDAILIKVVESGLVLPSIFVIATVFLTAFYMFRVIFVTFFGKKDPEGHPHESPSVMTLPMWILAILSIVAGFAFNRGFESLFGVISEGEHATQAAAEPHWVGYLSLVLGLSGILLAYLIYHKEVISHESIRSKLKPIHTLLYRKYFLDDIAYFIYRRGLIDGISLLCGWFDRYIVDGIVNLVTWSTRKSGEVLRMLQTGVIQDYLYGVILGILIFILLGVF